jgi:hypothetical protein
MKILKQIRERRPWKIWDASRIKKRLVLASSLEELHSKGGKNNCLNFNIFCIISLNL